EANLIRRVWLYVEGSLSMFGMRQHFLALVIGGWWGEVMQVDERTSNRRDLEVGR
ncbi:hypothetical protein U1Q18_034579, partial [Sarracenia purpurea var. burkii]